MLISARNKLRGKIEEIQFGDVMAHIVIRVGDNLIESAVTRRSADEPKLKHRLRYRQSHRSDDSEGLILFTEYPQSSALSLASPIGPFVFRRIITFAYDLDSRFRVVSGAATAELRDGRAAGWRLN
jgi:molybdopterin-binding protein